MNKREQHIINLIKARIRKKNPQAEVILFGSHARGEAELDSDWDILILLNNLNVSRKTEKEYREELDVLVRRLLIKHDLHLILNQTIYHKEFQKKPG